MTDFPIPEFEFVLEEVGWAHLNIRTDGLTHTVDRISYLTGGLHDLLFAGLELSLRHRMAVVRFDHEGWESRLTFSREWSEFEAGEEEVEEGDGERCRMTLIEEAGGKEETLFSVLCKSADDVAASLLKAGRQVWSELGPEEYDRRWSSHGFPNRPLLALEAALGVKPCLGRYDRE